METYVVRIVFTDGEVEVREYKKHEDAEKCIRNYSTCEECKHVHYVEEQ